MLESFRKVPKVLLAVILLGVSVSFIFWGIGDIFQFNTSSPLVRIGDRKIDAQTFQAEFNRFVREMSQRTQQDITTEQAKALGLDRSALERVIARTAMEQKARELGLSVSQAQVIDMLKSIPGLTDQNGNIDPQRLGQLLQSNQMSEANFLSQLQGDMIQTQLVESVLSNITLPPQMVEALQRYRLERRVAEYVLIDPSRAGEIKDPDEATLKKYYEEHAADRFTSPEYRTATVVTASNKDVASRIEVKDEDIKAYYDARKAQYVTPEKRKVEQISFADEAKARAAHAELTGGKSFEDVAKAAGFKPEDIQLGEISAGDRAVPAEAFSTEVGKFSQPIKGAFGWVIVRPTSSTPGTVKTLDEARQEIRETLQAERAKDELFKLTNDFEDARAGGATLEEAAKKYNLTVTKVVSIDAQGRDAAGNTVENLPIGNELISKIFQSETGVDSDLTEASDGTYYELRVDEVKPAARKAFETVRAEALSQWRDEELEKHLKALADQLVKRGNGGESIAAIAASLGTAPLKSDPLPRFPATAVFSQDALRKLFDAKIGGFFSGPVAEGKSLIVARADSAVLKNEDANSPERSLYADQLNQAFSGDIAQQFANGVRDEQGVTIDEKQFQRFHTGE